MKRMAGASLVALGAGLVVLGLLFLVGMAGELRRLAVALVSMAAGAVAAGLGLRLYRQADAASPAQLRAEILELARSKNGEITTADVEAALGRRAARADEVLRALVAAGRCRRHEHEGAAYYVFAELQPRMMVRRCQYCRFELPLSAALGECPRCGGSLRTDVEKRSLGGDDLYGMDE
jgi:hypothetical protein